MDKVLHTPFDVEPDEALQVIRHHKGPLLIDLDETLYLQNSTEDFVDTAWPSPLAFLLMKLLDKIQPWRWTGGSVTRDAWRIRVIFLLLPWTLFLWHWRARRLASSSANKPLIDSIQANPNPPLIVTFGFMQIVKPLISGLGLSGVRIVAMSPWSCADRKRGKLAVVTDAIGDIEVKQSLLVTDSHDDMDILQKCGRPLRVVWPAAKFKCAFRDTYIPGQYLSCVKRPGIQYVYRGIILEDFMFWILSSLALAANPVTHVIGLALLAVSFWAIYETGYVDNDQVGALFEKNPKLPDAYHNIPIRISTALAWVWALICGALALVVLRWPALPQISDAIAWVGVLCVTFFGFRIYSRFDKQIRIWMFVGLQILRISAFVAIVPVTVVGMIALCAHALSRWVPYYFYRLAGGGWSDGYQQTMRLLFFSIMSLMLAAVLGWHILWSVSALALLAWNLHKARHELNEILRSAHRIDR